MSFYHLKLPWLLIVIDDKSSFLVDAAGNISLSGLTLIVVSPIFPQPNKLEEAFMSVIKSTELFVTGIPASTKFSMPFVQAKHVDENRTNRNPFKNDFFNGVFNTLDEVVEFYNNGGGQGLGIAPPNQSLPFEK